MNYSVHLRLKIQPSVNYFGQARATQQAPPSRSRQTGNYSTEHSPKDSAVLNYKYLFANATFCFRGRKVETPKIKFSDHWMLLNRFQVSQIRTTWFSLQTYYNNQKVLKTNSSVGQKLFPLWPELNSRRAQRSHKKVRLGVFSTTSFRRRKATASRNSVCVSEY